MWLKTVSFFTTLLKFLSEVFRNLEANRNIELGERRAHDKAVREVDDLRRRLDDADRMLDNDEKRP